MSDVTNKTKAAPSPGLRIREPDRSRSGPLSEFLRRMPADRQVEETYRWYRSQMRSWALFWRDRFAIAALLGLPEERTGETPLYLAKVYRDHSRKLLLSYPEHKPNSTIIQEDA